MPIQNENRVELDSQSCPITTFQHYYLFCCQVNKKKKITKIRPCKIEFLRDTVEPSQGKSEYIRSFFCFRDWLPRCQGESV